MTTEAKDEGVVTTTKIKDGTGNPGPLGLMGFGMTAVLLCLHFAEPKIFALNSMILSMAIFYGGIAQVIAGTMEMKKGNTFAATALTSYGLLWLSLVAMLTMPTIGWVNTVTNTTVMLAAAPANNAMSAYMFMWGVFTIVLFLATFKMNRVFQVVFGLATLLFFIMALGDGMLAMGYADGATVTRIGGYEGIVLGFVTMYAALAQVLNEVFGRTVAPLFPIKQN